MKDYRVGEDFWCNVIPNEAEQRSSQPGPSLSAKRTQQLPQQAIRQHQRCKEAVDRMTWFTAAIKKKNNNPGVFLIRAPLR